ncbi:MAG TPA: hypothetical protein VK206_16635 [Anaerolineales bacterium]|nr:hypothetical protein [Anaerolineales bacterium]
MDSSSVELMEQNAALIRAAETVVSSSFTKPINFTSMERLTGPGGDSILYRCESTSRSEPTVSFMIKKFARSLLSVENLNAEEGKRFLNDWVGAEFLSSLHLDNPISPYFYGGDLEQGFFVLEDLGEHRNLVNSLLQGDPVSAENGLGKYYTALGTLHAITAGKASVFEAMFSARFPGQQPFAEELLGIEKRMQKVYDLLDQLGVPTTNELADEIESVTDVVTLPGSFLAYIHGDPCPDNLFDMGDHYRFIDFEWGHFGHALLDAIYPRMMWPSCWCANRLPEDMIAKMETSYRAELVKGCPEVQEDAVWELSLVQMCGMTLLNRLAWDLEIALQEDRKRGIASIRQRTLAQLETFVKIAENFKKLPALCGIASHLLSVLQRRWVDMSRLPLYPAFDQTQAG